MDQNCNLLCKYCLQFLGSPYISTDEVKPRHMCHLPTLVSSPCPLHTYTLCPPPRRQLFRLANIAKQSGDGRCLPVGKWHRPVPARWAGCQPFPSFSAIWHPFARGARFVHARDSGMYFVVSEQNFWCVADVTAVS